MKIFIISLPKTGTTSVCKALELVGYSSIHYPKTLEDIEQYDSAGDSFVAINYKKLDSLYPNAKFIYVKRDIERWLLSLERHLSTLPVPNNKTMAYKLRVDSLGSASFKREINKQKFIEHEREVLEYFSNRASDLLILKLDDTNKWSKISEFLNIDEPEVPFPVLNVKSSEFHISRRKEQLLNLLFMMPFANRISEVWLSRQLEMLSNHIRLIATKDGLAIPKGILSIPTSKRINESHFIKRLLKKSIRFILGDKNFTKFRFHRAVKKLNVNKILIHYADYAISTQHLWSSLGIEVFVHVHGKDIHLNKREELSESDRVLNGTYHNRLLEMSKQVKFIANSKTSQKMLLDLGINSERILVKYFGVPQQPDELITAQDNITSKPVVILFLGRLVDCKGPDQVINAFDVVRGRGANAELVIAGDGELLALCHTLRDSSPYKDDIKLIGAVDQEQATKLYSSADIFCAYHCVGPTSGRVETFGVTLIEAMSYGLPVLTCAVGGPAEIVKDNQNGVLVRENDFDDYTEKLMMLCENYEHRRALGMKAREYASKYFNAETEYNQLINFLSEKMH